MTKEMILELLAKGKKTQMESLKSFSNINEADIPDIIHTWDIVIECIEKNKFRLYDIADEISNKQGLAVSGKLADDIITYAFNLGENWGLTYGGWFAPTETQSEAKRNEARVLTKETFGIK